MKKIYLVLALAFISSMGRGQTQLAAWVFDATAAAPSTPAFVAADLGAQAGSATLYANGTNGSSTWITATTGNELTAFAGNVLNDPRGTPVAGNSYCPVGGTGFSANGKSMVFVFSMSGYENPVLSFATRGTTTGFNTHQWAWSTDNITYTNFGTNTAQAATTWVTRTLDMSAINSLDGATTVYLKVTFGGATNATGNNRLDNIVINANAVGTPSLSVSSASLAFGSLAVGSQSASQTYDLSGSNLTGAPGSITVNAPSTDFQVSNDNSTWGASTTIAYASATLSATPVYVRFTPQTGGPKSGNITFSGGGVSTPPTVSLTGTGTATYYSKSSGNLTSTATWGVNTDGSGASPADFVSDGQVFIVTNRASVTLDADMTVSGSGAKVVVGDGVVATELVIPATAALTATTDVQNLGTLTLQHATLPTFGTLATGSTVNYAQAGSFTIPQRAYYNLTATGGTKLLAGNTTTVAGNFVLDGATGFNGPTASPFATLALAGNFTMQNGAAFEPNGTGDLGRITLTMNGSGTQTISGGDVYLFRLQTPNTPATTVNINLGTSTNLYLGNPSSGGLNLQQAAHTLSLNGNTLTIQQSGLFSTSNVGTITGSATSNVIVNKTSGTGNMGTVGFTAGSQVLNNFTYNSAGTGTNNLTLATTLTVNSTLTLTNGNILLGANNLTVAGTVSGGSATSYVVTNGTGSLKINNVGATNVIFPVGPSTTLYHPATINNSGTVDNFSVNVASTPVPCADPAFTVNSTWNITEEVTGGSNCALTLDFTGATTGASFAAASAKVVDCGGSAPYYNNGSVTGTVATGSGFTSFSPFGATNDLVILPVSFVNFSGYKAGTVNKFTWTTANEQNSRGFDVQRSTDGVNYVSIGFVNTQAVNGNSDASLSYSFTDVNPTGSKQYYRLRQADVNGGSKYSTVIVIKGEKANTLVIDGLYPNPANSQLNVALSSPARGTVTLQVVDMTGRVLAQQVKAIAEGSNTVSLNVAGLSNGSYILKVVNAETGAVSAKFSKQ